jgi:E3 ubiquitin-protein ligase UBR1
MYAMKYMHAKGALYDGILERVSTFSYPSGLTDRGTYILKDEYYDQVTPWFWHYTRNERNSMIELLSKRNRVKGTGDIKIGNLHDFKSHGLIFPDYPQLVPGNAFASIRESIVSSQSFVKIMWISIFNVTREQANDKILPIRNESILIRCLHFIIIGIQASNAFLVSMSTLSVGSLQKHSTILQLLLDLLSRGQEEFLIGVVPLLKFILLQLENQKVSNVSSIIEPWKEAMVAKKTSSLEKDDSAKRRKEEAKARMAKIKAGFVKTQTSFVETHDLDPDVSPLDGKHSSDWRYPSGNCVICSEDVDENSALYATMGFLQTSSLEPSSSGTHASSCGHLIHASCFAVYWNDLLTVCTQINFNN